MSKEYIEIEVQDKEEFWETLKYTILVSNLTEPQLNIFEELVNDYYTKNNNANMPESIWKHFYMKAIGDK